MSNPIRTLCRLGNWTLIAWTWRARRRWTYRRMWGWLPGREMYWSGKLVHYTLGPLELIHDKRGGLIGVLSDMTGLSREELQERLEAKP